MNWEIEQIKEKNYMLYWKGFLTGVIVAGIALIYFSLIQGL